MPEHESAGLVPTAKSRELIEMYWPASMAARGPTWRVTDIRALANGWHLDVSLRVIQQAGTKASDSRLQSTPAKESALPRCLAVSDIALASGLRPEHLAILNIVVPNDGGCSQALQCP
jgi:hypothetical protein